MRAGEDVERQTEGRIVALAVAVGGGAEVAEGGVDLQAGAEEDHPALERREAEDGGEALQGGGGGESRRGALQRRRCCRAAVFRRPPGEACGVRFESRPHAVDRRQQVLMVRFEPER